MAVGGVQVKATEAIDELFRRAAAAPPPLSMIFVLILNRAPLQAMGMSGPTIILGSDVLKLGKGAMIVSFVSRKVWLAL